MPSSPTASPRWRVMHRIDLKNMFVELFAARALLESGRPAPRDAADLDRLGQPASYGEFFGEVIGHIASFVALRDASPRERVRDAPLFVHGYDHLQPRPAGASIFAGPGVGRGPWLYPTLLAAGLTDAQMRTAADAVIDHVHVRQRRDVRGELRVQLVELKRTRGSLRRGSR